MFVELMAAAALAQTATSEPPEIHRPAASERETEKPNPEFGPRSPEDWAAACKDWDEWDKPGPPFAIAPRLFYVGTCGITSLVVVAQDGNVLIDTGTQDGIKLVLSNVERTLVDPGWIRLILTSHEHFDHVGGVAHAQRVTGAPVVASTIAANVLRSGVADPSDPQSGMHDPMEPARAVVPIAPGQVVTFGGIEFRSIATPGHTPGALSWQWEICGERSYEPAQDPEDCVSIVYADSLSPVSNDEYRFSDHPEYVAEYRAGLQRLREIKCDILLTPHPSASKMLERAATGSLEGGLTCLEYANTVERRLNARLEREASAEQ